MPPCVHKSVIYPTVVLKVKPNRLTQQEAFYSRTIASKSKHFTKNAFLKGLQNLYSTDVLFTSEVHGVKIPVFLSIVCAEAAGVRAEL